MGRASLLSDTEMELESPGGSSHGRPSLSTARDSISTARSRRSSCGSSARMPLGAVETAALGSVCAANAELPPQSVKATLATVVDQMPRLEAAQMAREASALQRGFEPVRPSGWMMRMRQVLP